MAFLAGLALGKGNYRVFYSDIIAVVTWLAGEPAKPWPLPGRSVLS